jgi:hypothetical protein
MKVVAPAINGTPNRFVGNFTKIIKEDGGVHNWRIFLYRDVNDEKPVYLHNFHKLSDRDEVYRRLINKENVFPEHFRSPVIPYEEAEKILYKEMRINTLHLNGVLNFIRETKKEDVHLWWAFKGVDLRYFETLDPNYLSNQSVKRFAGCFPTPKNVWAKNIMPEQFWQYLLSPLAVETIPLHRRRLRLSSL